MSRKPTFKVPLRQITSNSDGVRLLRGRDPKVMKALWATLSPRRALFSWLTPGVPLIGIPSWANQDMPWLTMIDDLDPDTAGPEFFDQPSLRWWIERAQIFFIDAATPNARVYKIIGDRAARGYSTLAVQTTEERRVIWQNYFVRVHPQDQKAIAFHQIRSPVLGGPEQVLRMGSLTDDFASVRPVLSDGKLITQTIH